MAKTMYDEWRYQKARVGSDKLILFRCGDFYETMCEDAEVCHKVLGVTLTKRTTPGDIKHMAGFPYHALDSYLPKLVRAGYRVAIVDGEQRTVVSKENINNQNNNKEMETKKNNQESVNGVENEEQKAFRIISNTAQYVYRDGKLQKLDYVRREFDMVKVEVEQYFRVGGGDEELLTIDGGEFYASEDAFKNGEKCDPVMVMTTDAVFSSLNGWGMTDGRAWIMQDGKAVQWDVRDHVKHITATTRGYSTKDVDLMSMETYRKAQDVYDWNRYKKVDGDGNETTVEGRFYAYRMEDDQREAFRKLQEALKACNAVGLHLVADNEDSSIGMVNWRRVKDSGYYGDVSLDEETERTEGINWPREQSLNGEFFYDDTVCVFDK